MILNTIEKQNLLGEPYSDKALKLAHALYNTYIRNDKELFIDVSVNTLIKLLKILKNRKALNELITVFEELNEPIMVKNFKFYQKTYPMRFLHFCKYNIVGDMVEIELSEEFLHMESTYMKEEFLTK